MARPTRKIPVPYLRENRGVFKLRWTVRENNKNIEYQITLGKIDKNFAELICAASKTAFAERTEFPEEIRDDPGLLRYLAKKADVDISVPESRLIDNYYAHMTAKCKSDWPVTVRCHLKDGLKYMGTVLNATSAAILSFLDAVNLRTSNATRNRALMALSGFYKWLRTIKRVPKGYNPLENIGQIAEERNPEGIVIWEGHEVRSLLRRARRRKDGIAVWIAVLAGLRRSEIAALKWDNVTESYIIVEKSKTGKKRQVPMSPMLYHELMRFRDRPEEYGKTKIKYKEKGKAREEVRLADYRKSGLVVPWPVNHGGWKTAARRMVELHLPGLFPKLYKTNPEKFGWNAFRHTFASRHAQEGLSLDIIAAWLGDSPQVCKEHYARYVPKNMRDTRIDMADKRIAN
jgi:integrase